jgi:flavin reductase (DIM6/NTAB) family NADH-FMN oxidoreductase RutF
MIPIPPLAGPRALESLGLGDKPFFKERKCYKKRFFGGATMEPSITEAFLQIPYGIYVLATSQTTGPRAMVVSWVSQVSYSPPLLMAALRQNRPAIPAILDRNIFSLNLLKEDQDAWVDRFKIPPPSEDLREYFEQIRVGRQKFYRLKDGLAFFACRVVSKIDPGDHLLVVAEALAASAEKGRPLITSDCGKSYVGRT